MKEDLGKTNFKGTHRETKQKSGRAFLPRTRGNSGNIRRNFENFRLFRSLRTKIVSQNSGTNRNLPTIVTLIRGVIERHLYALILYYLTHLRASGVSTRKRLQSKGSRRKDGLPQNQTLVHFL